MPIVNGIHYPYTKERVKKALESKKEKNGYSTDVIAMAMKMRKGK